jgi:hypothetical protein
MYKTKKNGKIQYQCCYSCYRKEGGDTGLYNRSSKPIENKNLEDEKKSVYISRRM